MFLCSLLSKNYCDFKSQTSPSFPLSPPPVNWSKAAFWNSHSPVCFRVQILPLHAEDLMQAHTDPTGQQGISSSPESPLPRQSFQALCNRLGAAVSSTAKGRRGRSALDSEFWSRGVVSGRGEGAAGPDAENRIKTTNVLLLACRKLSPATTLISYSITCWIFSLYFSSRSLNKACVSDGDPESALEGRSSSTAAVSPRGERGGSRDRAGRAGPAQPSRAGPGQSGD